MKNTSFKFSAACTSLIAISFGLTGCFGKSSDATGAASVKPATARGSSEAGPDNSLIETITPGAGNTLAPTGDALMERIKKALPGASQTSNFCGRAYTQQISNLNYSPNPMKANLGGPISLLIYSCCSDVNPNTAFGVPAGNTFNAAAQSAVAAAGVKILDAYMGGLASSGPMAAQVSKVFSDLSAQNAAVANITTPRAFVSACVAAVTYGATMTGF